MSKNQTVEDAGREGGKKTKRLYGSAHFSKIAIDRHKKLKKKDPYFYDRLQAAGYHGRQMKIQAKIAEALGEKLRLAPDRNHSSSNFFKVLTGRG